MKKNKEPSLYTIDLENSSSLNQAFTTTKAIFEILGEWMILILTCSIALFFIPLTPSFTLHSTTSTFLNVTNQNNFTSNLSFEFLAEDSNTIGSTINYDSLLVSLFHRQEKLSTYEPAKSSSGSIQEAMFRNVSVLIDEWNIANDDDLGYGKSCGFVYMDLFFSANARYTQLMWPVMKDKIEGHCGEVKVEICSSGSTAVVNSFNASCDVYSDLVTKVRIVLFGMLIFLLVIVVAVPLLVEHFFCHFFMNLGFNFL